jgi:hypothetical protein
MIRAFVWGLILVVPGPAVLAQDSPKGKEGKADLKVEGKLSPQDPKDKDRKDSPHQVHRFTMQAGKTYIIFLSSRDFDCYLRLEDSKGKQLAFNDDAGPGTLNSQLVFTAPKDDNYRLIVTSFDGKSGAFTLTARQASGKLSPELRLAVIGGMRDAYETAYQNKDKDAPELLAKVRKEIKKLAKDYPELASQAKELTFVVNKLSIGRKAMEIEGEDLDGKTFKLSDYRGKVVVIDFWGNW